jgi:parallel beta-helix repeat protein
VLIDDVEVEGAADAGIYVGQSTKAIVRNSKVHGSVAGIESENTTDMDIRDNEVYDNSAGVLVFALPHLTKKDALRTHVFNNLIHDNNHANFGAAGSVVSNVPVGIGVLLLACDGAEVDHNTIVNQGSGGIVIVSGSTLQLLDSAESYDDGTDSYPEGLYLHDNTFTGCGQNPSSPLSVIPVRPLEDIIWDGNEKTPGMGSICLGTSNLPTFRDVNGIPNLGVAGNQSTSTAAYTCVGTALTPLDF